MNVLRPMASDMIKSRAEKIVDYSICRGAKNRKHVPDTNTIVKADGADFIVDVNCTLCGSSGSARVDPKDFSWE
jgi:hypothetical protein